MITTNDIEHISWLAHIWLTDSELEEYSEKINPILEYFGTLDEVEGDVDAAHHVLDLYNVWRDDVPSEMLSQEEALSNAKEIKDGYFKAARIL
ncbi:MAG: Asp-tRNA(Asn)/Glu-tRNA(Gln) amidotransferase subunit GatC [Methanosarcinales archaeon]|nr:MAG: Asp-tRNA(Asn)/Glu-tRNA(Gln) amidotransferase subunit GatC [Methanosarcinales archaeon]